MKILVVMRGAPGAGKSTFIDKMGWTPYTICPDQIRLMFEGPVMDSKTGQMFISQKNDRDVWKLALDLLKKRMEHGEFIVFDATNSKSQDFTKYKKLIEQYRYRAYCVDFSDVSLETCLEQNRGRLKTSTPWKFVPENVIENIYSRMKTQPVPGYFKVIPHDEEACKKITENYKKDLNEYEDVVVIGDIHGCYEPVEKWFKDHPFSDKTYYIFLGDYIDRGLQNKEVLEFLEQICEKPNVVLLTGNHEKWIVEYADGLYDDELKAGVPELCRSKEFFFNTYPQIALLDRNCLRRLCKKFSQLVYFTFDGKDYIVTHGGFGHMPENLAMISADSFIRPRDYNEPIDEWFQENHGESNLWQIHGHRNPMLHEADKYSHSINLCDEVEFGKNLRILKITKDS